MSARTRRRISSLAAAVLVLCSFVASRAWSDTGRAGAGPACPAVTCVESLDGAFCLCRAGAEVCAGEHAATSCSEPLRPAARAEGGCCVSPAGFCYCSRDAACTAPDDRLTDRCDATLRADSERSCALAL